jgi:hypothetical protein
METNYIVYRDREYTTSWISHELADEIANYLTGYLFSWDTVPGDGSEEERLLRYLKDDHDIVWAENVEISKSDDNIIQIEDENLSATITLVDDELKATLKINGDWKCDLKVKKEDDKLNIYLKGKGFKMLGANELGKWMKAVICSEDTKNTVVVFAQDVAPDTVFEHIVSSQDDGIHDTVFDNIGATALIRQYLDRGGRVVWIGDLPFSYRGTSGAKKVEQLQNSNKNAYRTDLSGSSINVLSVIPIFSCAPRRSVKITKEGRKMGLMTVWSSIRPITAETGIIPRWAVKYMGREFVEPLAKTEALISKAQIKYDKRGIYNWLKRFLSERVTGIEIGKDGIGLDLSKDSNEEEPKLRYFEGYTSAWFKNFNKEEPNSGFVRIWDFSPSVITNSMKIELCQVATYGLK